MHDRCTTVQVFSTNNGINQVKGNKNFSQLLLHYKTHSRTMISTTASHFLRRGNVAAAASAVGASSSVSQSSSFVAAAAAGVCRTLMATAAPAAAADTASPPLSLRKTSLHAWHQERGGEMVPFAGYELPVLYKGDKATEHSGVLQEHLWCRTEGQAALFDVSHMGQVRGFFFF